jgi:PIN domain nuclease of toxin-antitoxin system
MAIGPSYCSGVDFNAFALVTSDPKLPKQIGQYLEDNDQSIAIASISVYELVLLIQKQRIVIELPQDEWLHAATVEAGINVLDTNYDIARQAALLPWHHGDPLDRIIIASTLHHNALLASIDTKFSHYEVLQEKLITGKDMPA